MPKPVPRGPRPLLERILDTPHLPAVVPRLQPEVLHRVIQSCGLHDCAELVALATPAQLNRVFDLDLWRPPRPGTDETFDAARFGDWLEVLMDCGEEIAASKLQGLDVDLVVTGLAQHIAVFDRAAVSRGGLEIGGYLVEVRRTGSWDAIASLLEFLHTDHQALFHRLMAGCRRLSSSTPEADGFHHLAGDRDQDMFDLAIARDERREQQGYLTPPQARAFLQLARQVTVTADAPPVRDPIAASYFRTLDAPLPAAANAAPESASAPIGGADVEIATAGVVEMLREAGVVSDQPRGLLAAANEPTLSRIQAHLLHSADGGDELAFLANAIVGGSSVQGRLLTEREGADAAMATCNLGLENWPPHWPPADLVSAFKVGWRTLHDEVAMYAARCVVDALGDIRIDDDGMQDALDRLRLGLIRGQQDGTPWAAAGALDVLATLDMLAWAVLVAAIAECPVEHAAVGASRRHERSVSAQAFAFIAENSQIAAVQTYMQTLADVLLG